MFQRSELNHQHAFISRRPNISPSIPSSSGNKYLSLSRDFLVSIMISVDTRSRGKRPCMNVRHSSKNRLFYLHAVSHTRRMSQTIFFYIAFDFQTKRTYLYMELCLFSWPSFVQWRGSGCRGSQHPEELTLELLQQSNPGFTTCSTLPIMIICPPKPQRRSVSEAGCRSYSHQHTPDWITGD